MITLPFAKRQAEVMSPTKYWMQRHDTPASSVCDDTLFVLRLLTRSLVAPFHRSFLLGLFENSGYTLLKLGQWISTRHDMFPESVCRTLASLRERAPAHRMVDSHRFVEGLGIKLGELLGSGTVAQVYRSHFEGRDVAVKILHPDARYKVLKELATLGKIADLLSRLSFLHAYDLKSQFREFSKGFVAQCDLRSEAHNMQLLGALNPGVLVPQPLFANENVLVEDYIACENVSRNPDPRLAAKCADFFLNMINNHRFMHADLHGGNFKKTTQGDVVVLDGGLCKYLTTQEQRNLHDLVFALLLSKDGREAGRLLVDRLPKNAGVDKVSFVRDFEEMCRKYIYRPEISRDCASFFSHFAFVSRHEFAQYSVCIDISRSGEIMRDFHRILSYHNVILDSTYSTLLASLMCFDGTVHSLYRLMDTDTIRSIFLRRVPLLKYFLLDLRHRLRMLLHA